jgi:two-component system, sensor histidine kinase LadS
MQMKMMLVAALVWWLGAVVGHAPAFAAGLNAGEVTQAARYFVDESGQMNADAAQSASEQWPVWGSQRSFDLNGGKALWMRLDLPKADNEQSWFLMQSVTPFLDKVEMYARAQDGAWSVQRAGDSLPVAQWSQPDQTAIFRLSSEVPNTVWLRFEHKPSAVSPRLYVMNELQRSSQRHWTYLLLGIYLGFGLLVALLALMHARLYNDRVFVAYGAYVIFMLACQMAYTGIGGLFFWPHSPAWNNISTPLFGALLIATGIWFKREACSIPRLSPRLAHVLIYWALLGLALPVVFLTVQTKVAITAFNLYGALSVLLGMGLCLWAWRRGERYALWFFIGFLPVDLTFPFSSLRNAGVVPDSWHTQYALVIGSMIEIPLLLWILHRRAKEFNENRARTQTLEYTDALTGLINPVVLLLRGRDVLRRSLGKQQSAALILAELANHEVIIQKLGRQIGERALVLTADKLVSVAGQFDTVSRVGERRFAVLLEGPLDPFDLTEIAQRMVAHGLSEQIDAEQTLGTPLSLRLKIASVLLADASVLVLDDPDTPHERQHEAAIEATVERLHSELDLLVADSRRAIVAVRL